MKNKFPTQFTITNIIKRCISLLRDIDKKIKKINEDNLSHIMKSNNNANNSNIDFIKSIKDYLKEFDQIQEPLIKNVSNIILDGEIIAVMGYRDLCIDSLIDAKKENKIFSVIIIEIDEKNKSETNIVKSLLDKNNIKNMIISFASVFSILPKINRILIECESAFQDGSILTKTGGDLIAVSAKEFSIPIVSITPLYKISNNIYFKQEVYNIFKGSNNFFMDYVEVVNIEFDFIKNDYIDLHITQDGESPTNYFYRICNELYFDDCTQYDF